jgi:hypothetical protein
MKRHCGRESTYANSDILGGSEEAVDEDTDKRRIKTIFSWQTSEKSITHALRHNDRSNGKTSNNL